VSAPGLPADPGRTEIALAAGLAAAAGAVDVLAFTRMGQAFASIVTGNLVVAGTAIGQGDPRMPANVALAVAAFAVVALVWNEFDDWKVVAILWLIGGFVVGVWLTSGPLAARDRWALIVGFAAAVAGMAMAWLNLNWLITPAAAWFVAVALVSASVVKAALRWPDLRWFENPTHTKQHAVGALTTLVMCTLITGATIV